jgi:hypothetical protein
MEIPEFDPRDFVYPEFIRDRIIYAEDIEEAIIEYLERRGFDREALQTSGEWMYRGDDHLISTKLLQICF